ARAKRRKAPASASLSSAKSCERIAAASASQTIRAAALSSLCHFRLCKPEIRRSPANAQGKTRDKHSTFNTQLSIAAFETDDIERNRGASGAALAEGERRRLKPSPLSSTRRFREEKRRAVRLNRRHHRRCRREGDPFASRPPFCSSPHSWTRSHRYICRCGR